ncbi:hypothetical protein HanIR_Chr15g0772041 [Helianthus annuus]|nr:hypothetical protein HanIR_Chr15g0772041 [Helianthus annuus]
MASSSSDSSPLPNTLANFVHIKLSSTKYLLWKNQLEPLLSLHDLIGHVNGSSPPPDPTVTTGDKTTANPRYLAWLATDRRTVVLINATLSEEAMSAVVGLKSAREIWSTLESTFGNTSVECVQSIKDRLRSLTKGSKTVAEYGRQYKELCDQLAAVGDPLPRTDQTHGFLYGPRTHFREFFHTGSWHKPDIPLPDLIAKADGHDHFYHTLHGSSSSTVAYSVTSERGRDRGSNTHGRGVLQPWAWWTVPWRPWLFSPSPPLSTV